MYSPAVWACGLPTWQWRGSCIPKAGSGIWRACLFGPGSWRWATLSIIRSARPWGLHLSNNIFLTLALGVLMLNILVGSNPATQWGGASPVRRGVDTPSFRRNPCLGSQSFLRRRYPDSSLSSHHLFVPGTDGSCAMYSILRCPLCCFFWFLSLTPQRRRPCKCWHLTRTFCLLRSCPSFLIMMAHEGLIPREASTFSMCFTPLHLWVIGILALWLA